MNAFGVYVHVPFCRHRCGYCAFATFTDRDGLMEAYLGAMVVDIERAVQEGMPPADTVFVGGGTPTRVPATGLVAVLDAIPRTAGAEVTVECNPDDLTDEMVAVYAAGGVNRLSIGVQSMVPHVLGALDRTHDPANVRRAVATARAGGVDDVNLDLIYGVAGETVDDWRATLQAAVALEPTHVSAYGLTVEGGTALAERPDLHPDDDVQADMYEIADDALTAAGLANYEISNWAVPGRECRHNRIYWDQGDYRGFGSAAHSHAAGRRWWNVRTPDRYIDLIMRGESAESSAEVLDDETRRIEGLQLALRTRDGVPRDALDVDALGDLVEVRAERVVLTRRGRLLANDVATRLR